MLHLDHSRKAARQGDVLVVPVAPRPKRGTPIAHGQVVLAEGETTGHAHVIHSDRVTMFRPDDTSAAPLLHVEGATVVALSHEEHRDVSIGPGDSVVVQQRVRSVGMWSQRAYD